MLLSSNLSHVSHYFCFVFHILHFFFHQLPILFWTPVLPGQTASSISYRCAYTYVFIWCFETERKKIKKWIKGRLKCTITKHNPKISSIIFCHIHFNTLLCSFSDYRLAMAFAHIQLLCTSSKMIWQLKKIKRLTVALMWC